MRIVADTNVLVSAVITEGKPRELLRRCVGGEWTLVTSPVLVGEFADVLRRPKFRLTDEVVRRALAGLLDVAELVEPIKRVQIIREDPDDNAVLEAALQG